MVEKMGSEAATMKIQPVEAIVQLVYSLAEIIPVRIFGFSAFPGFIIQLNSVGLD